MARSLPRRSGFFDDQRGVSSVEYGLLLVGILLVVAGAFRALGGKHALVANTTTSVLLGGQSSLTVAGGPGGGAGSGAGSAPGNMPPTCDGPSCGIPGGNCFVAGTPVWTPRGERPIEHIAVGDTVLSRDEATGQIREQRVVRWFVRIAPSLLDVAVARGDSETQGDSETLRTTPEHRFWSRTRGWMEAKELAKGEPLHDAAGRTVRVVSVTEVPVAAAVYNFEVESTHTYFVGRLGTWVHNTCDPIKPVFDGLSGPANPHVAANTVGAALANGTLPPNGSGNFTINPSSGQIAPAAPNTGGSFPGQYIGLMKPTPQTPNLPIPVDPNTTVVFTDNLTGCCVSISQDSPPQLLHMPAAELGDNPTDYDNAIEPYMQTHGMDPHPANGHPPIVVTASNYGWVIGGGEHGAHNSQAFLYGVKTENGMWKWWLLKIGRTEDGTGYNKVPILVGTTHP